MVRIDERLDIPDGELQFTASRSGGPGGQHVNKVSSRVTLHFDVGGSPSLSDAQRRRISEKLSTRITRGGVLKLHARRFRSQAANRRLLVERFAELLRGALARRRPRRRTRVPGSEIERRLEAKRRRSALKRSRRSRADDEA